MKDQQTQEIQPLSNPPLKRGGKEPKSTESPYTPILEKLGLSKNEAQMYELLIQTGPQGMKAILFHTKLKRGNAYYHLDNLIEKGLVEKQDLPGQTTKFIAKHPEQLGLLLAKQKAAVFSAEEELTKNLPQLRSLYQLAAIKPTVKYFEGLEGAKKVVEDSLTSNTEIYSYSDNEVVHTYYPEINRQFVESRQKKGIKKKIITIDTPYMRKHAKSINSTFTQMRIIPNPAAFSTIMYIYDNKVSYISINASQEKMIGMIIENETIYKMHKTLFEALWQSAKPIF
jgi:sugar-specific transcriptional regulator TrmB